MTSLIIISIPKGGLTLILTRKIFTNIGRMSYSIYLWHWGVIVISNYTIGIHSWTIPLQLALIIFFSFVSYNYIEKTFKKFNPKKKYNYILYFILCNFITQISVVLSIGNYLKRYLYFGNLQGIHQRELNTKGLNPNFCNLAKVKFSNLIEDKNCFPKKQNTPKKDFIIR